MKKNRKTFVVSLSLTRAVTVTNRINSFHKDERRRFSSKVGDLLSMNAMEIATQELVNRRGVANQVTGLDSSESRKALIE